MSGPGSIPYPFLQRPSARTRWQARHEPCNTGSLNSRYASPRSSSRAPLVPITIAAAVAAAAIGAAWSHRNKAAIAAQGLA
eukprot:1160312-Pelagomonas_calceolata.AAC.6